MKIKDGVFYAMYLAAAITGMSLIKFGGQQGENGDILRIAGIPITVSMVLGLLFYGISFLLYITVISQSQLSLILPILAGINSILTVLVGLCIFKEHLQPGQIFGIVFIIMGVVITGICKH